MNMDWLRKAPDNGGWPAIFLMALSAGLLFSAWLLRGGQPFEQSPPSTVAQPLVAGPDDILNAHFTPCSSGAGRDCVVDGDTFVFRGERYRILDINTPETSTPRCEAELARGKAAARRLLQLLNAGPFSLVTGHEQTDGYGRKLRRVTRGGRSLGEVLIAEDLAEPWRGFRRNWC